MPLLATIKPRPTTDAILVRERVAQDIQLSQTSSIMQQIPWMCLCLWVAVLEELVKHKAFHKMFLKVSRRSPTNAAKLPVNATTGSWSKHLSSLCSENQWTTIETG